MRIVPVIVALAVNVVGPPPAPAQVMYTVHDLGALYPGGTSFATAINASGQTTGYSRDSSDINDRAFRVAFGGQVTDPGADLGTLGGSYSDGFGISDSGQVTGYSLLSGAGADAHAFRTTPTGSLNMAADLGGVSSRAYGINNVGQVVGYQRITGGFFRAFRTTPSGVIDASADLGVFPGGDNRSFGFAINASGQVTGTYGSASHAFRTTPTGTLTTATDLGSLAGTGTGSEGHAINASGQVVGISGLANGASHAFRSSPNGQPVSLQDLGTLGNDNASNAVAINNLGIVLGVSATININNGMVLSQTPFIFDIEMLNLNDLVPAGWTILDANAINDAGMIAADGSFQGGPEHALMLTPVPEPGSLALLGAAAGGSTLLRRRRAVSRQ